METIFLACFVFGLLFTLASLALGLVGDGLGHAHIGHVHTAHATHDGGHDSSSLPLLNASSLIGGLTWFGAAGYVLTRVSAWALPVAILAALVVGALGWYLVARFLGLLLKGEVEMDPDDYRLEGTVGQVSVAIPAGGTGEVLFEKGGSRRGEAARGVAGSAIPRGTEVVITAYADGFATVQPWTEFMAERDRAMRIAATPVEPVEKREA